MRTKTMKRTPSREWPHSEEMTAALAHRYFELLQRRYKAQGKHITLLTEAMVTEPPLGRHCLAYLSCAYYVAKRTADAGNIEAIRSAMVRLLDKTDTPEDHVRLRPVNRGMRLLGRLVLKGCQHRAENARH